jgi:hypothetical protein
LQSSKSERISVQRERSDAPILCGLCVFRSLWGGLRGRRDTGHNSTTGTTSIHSPVCPIHGDDLPNPTVFMPPRSPFRARYRLSMSRSRWPLCVGLHSVNQRHQPSLLIQPGLDDFRESRPPSGGSFALDMTQPPDATLCVAREGRSAPHTPPTRAAPWTHM